MRPLVAVVILLWASTASAADPHRITRINYDQVENGQSMGYVYVLLGRNDAVTFNSGPYKHLCWWIGDKEAARKIVYVYFKNDKVTGKVQYGL